MTAPVFQEYFDLGEEEEASPFLTPSSKAWGKNLAVKASVLSAFFLALSSLLTYLFPNSGTGPLALVFVYFLAGTPNLIESLEDLGNWDINIDMLMTLAAFSSAMLGSGFEGGLLLVLFSLSESIETSMQKRAKGAIQALHEMAPTSAHILTAQGRTKEKAIQDVTVGTLILVPSGEMVPLDGVIEEGASSLDLSHLTGETLPVSKKPGDEVPAGARNKEGSLVIRVTKTSSDSTLARIINLVVEAESTKPPLEKWFDRFSGPYAKSIILASLLFAVLLPFFLSIPFFGHSGSIYRALAFLVAASPCALILAVPIVSLSAISRAAREGILLKGGVTLAALSRCNAVAFDKTGTLTTGNLQLTDIRPLGTGDRQSKPLDLLKALEIASSLERNTKHPIAKAVVEEGEKRGVKSLNVTAFSTVPGYGVQGEVEGIPAFFGKPEADPKIDPIIKEMQGEGKMLALLQYGHNLSLFLFEDDIRKGLRETLLHLKKEGLFLIMLTGDHKSAAKKVQEALPIDEIYTDMTPESKMEKIGVLSKQYNLAMVGDGINDAPALTLAHVGISLAKIGSRAAVDASDIVFLQDDITKLDWLFAHAQKTRRVMKTNLIIAVSALFVASGLAIGGYIPLWTAVLLHEGGTVFVGLNALRLLR